MNVVLPEDYADIARQRAAALSLTVEEYLVRLIHAEDFESWYATLTPEQQAEQDDFDRAVEKGLDSGPPIDGEEFKQRTEQWLRELRARHAAIQGPA